jgi:anthranilate phosphoribosyltransferase
MNDSEQLTHADADAAMRSMIQRIATGPELSKDLSADEARLGMRLILEGQAHPVQAGIFLIALRMKRETDDENIGVLEAIRDATQSLEAPVDHVVDLVDPYDGFNRNLPVAPFLPAVLASCGVAAFSHGVQSVGPKYGATHRRVLGAAGVDVDRGVDVVAERLGNPDIAWGYVDQSVFCPKLHELTELRTLMVKRPVITTVEVMAGPLRGRRGTHLMTGYVHKPYPRIYAMLARHVGYESALLVRGVEGGVIPSMRQSGKIWHYRDGGEEQDVDFMPEELGIRQEVRGVPLPEGLPGYRKKTDDIGIKVEPAAIAEAAAQSGMDALEGKPGPARDALVFGAALCLWHLGRHPSLAAAADAVRQVLDSGRALGQFRAGM